MRRVWSGSLRFAAGLVLVVLALAPPAAAATLPSGFAETRVATGLAAPTAMAFAPDGRLFVAEQGGQLRVIKNGALLATPFLTVTVDSSGERGLLGVAFDPDFATNRFVYVYYTATTPTVHNRVSRFTATRRRRRWPGSEPIILDLDHALRRAPTTTAARSTSAPTASSTSPSATTPTARNAQTLDNRHGKMLRINADGTIPTDNPFFGTGDRARTARSGRSACATRSRSPSSPAPAGCSSTTSARTPGRRSTTASPGANYGWPATEGADDRPALPRPDLRLRARRRRRPTGCAITGGAFYNPPRRAVPGRATPATTSSPTTATTGSASSTRRPGHGRRLRDRRRGAGRPARSADDGSLYYLARGAGGSVFRVAYTAQPGAGDHRRSRRARRSASGSPRRSPSPASGSRAARVPVAAERRRHRRRDGGDATRSPRRSRATTAPASARASPTAPAASTSNAATLTVTTNQRADGDDHRAGRRHALPRRRDDRLRRHRHRPGGRHARRRALHLAGRLPPRRPRPPVRARRRAARRAARSRSRRPAHTRVERLVPHPPDGDRLGRPDVVDLPRRHPRRRPGHARDEPGRAAAPARRPAGHRRRSRSPAWSASSASSRRRRRRPSGGTSWVFESWSDGGARDADDLTPAATRRTPRPTADSPPPVRREGQLPARLRADGGRLPRRHRRRLRQPRQRPRLRLEREQRRPAPWDRNSSSSPDQRYDTLIQMQNRRTRTRPGRSPCPTAPTPCGSSPATPRRTTASSASNVEGVLTVRRHADARRTAGSRARGR